MRYKVNVKFVFFGQVNIEAETKEQAKEYIQKHVGCILPLDAIHTTMNSENVDWNFRTHPEKTIGKITRL